MVSEMNLLEDIFGATWNEVRATPVGASPSPAASAGKPVRALLIQVRDVPALVASKGGAAGAFAMKLVPETIAATVYGKMRDEFASKLKEQGVDADVQVVSPAAYQPAGVNPVWRPLAIGFGVAFAGFATWKVVDFIRRRRR